MRAAAEGVDARTRAGVRPLETPAPGEAEFIGAAEREVDDGLRIAGDAIVNPELCPAMLGLDGQEERNGGRVLGGVLRRSAGASSVRLFARAEV
jgi:hypothetical protein